MSNGGLQNSDDDDDASSEPICAVVDSEYTVSQQAVSNCKPGNVKHYPYIHEIILWSCKNYTIIFYTQNVNMFTGEKNLIIANSEEEIILRPVGEISTPDFMSDVKQLQGNHLKFGTASQPSTCPSLFSTQNSLETTPNYLGTFSGSTSHIGGVQTNVTTENDLNKTIGMSQCAC